MYNRVFLIVMDSVGIGYLPDADKYGDVGSNTLVNIARSKCGLFLPNLEKLGLGLIDDIEGVKKVTKPSGCYGKMAELSAGKDTTSGHWEMAGCPLFTPFPVYPQGFPQEVIDKFKALVGKDILGNKVASGTEIIKELGQEHIETGKPIIYTSADSVFQIAAHEQVVPLEELYKMCKIARTEVCIEKHAVGRIIARPFIGENGNFSRTTNRHDYSLLPPDQTVLDLLKEKQYDVVGIGKISDIFAQQGLTKSFSTKSNSEGMAVLKNLTTQTNIKGLIMANLVEFDSLYGHRNDVEGYAKALELFDKELGSLLPMLKADDLLIITADHGCDPTTASTDHSREYVPLLLYNEHLQGKNLGTRKTFADVAATIATNFNLNKMKYGENLL